MHIVKTIHIKRNRYTALALAACMLLSFSAFFAVRTGVFSQPGEPALVFFLYDDMSVGDFDRPETKIYPNLGVPTDDVVLNTTVGSMVGADFPDDPSSRIVGKRFTGWYVVAKGIEAFPPAEVPADAEPFDKDTVVDDIMVYVMAKWVADDIADVSDAEFFAYNAAGAMLSQPVQLADMSGAPTTISPDVTEYTLLLPGGASALRLNATLVDPKAQAAFALGEQAYTTAEQLQYTDSLDPRLIEMEKQTVASAKQVMASAPVSLADAEQLTITVTAPDGVNTKVYTFHLGQTNTRLEPAYGNTPYGRIMRDSSYPGDAERQLAKEQFGAIGNTDAPHRYLERAYPPQAWGSGEEIAPGQTPGAGQYINLDKDETALIAHIGQLFEDTGVTLYDESGAVIGPSAEHPVTRTIAYSVMEQFGFEGLDGVITQAAPQVDTLTGAAEENKLDFTVTQPVYPGIYQITYEYRADGKLYTAARALAVLPIAGDLNMDGAVTALDLPFAAADYVPSAPGIAALYRWRVRDLNGDGVLDDTDSDMLENRMVSAVAPYYPNSGRPDTPAVAYTPGEQPNPDKAWLTADYLGKNTDEITGGSTPLPESVQTSEILSEGDVFWVGYRVENAAAASDLLQNIYSFSLAMDYDKRYLEPAVVLTPDEQLACPDAAAQWRRTMEKYNIACASASDAATWSSWYQLTGSTEKALPYLENGGKASTALSKPYTKMLTFDIVGGGDSGSARSLLSGSNYVLRVPFRVIGIPPAGRQVLQTALGRETFAITDGVRGLGHGLVWDNSNLTGGLASVLDFRGEAALTFKDENPPVVLADATYGKSYHILQPGFARGELTGTLPKGLQYTRNVNTITGVPTEVGKSVFYIGVQRYEITVNKALLTVTADDKTRRYGDENPELTYQYSGFVLDDTADSPSFTVGLTAPDISCAAVANTPYLSSVPIVPSGGESTNYTFEYVEGQLTVNERRPVTVTALTGCIPHLTAKHVYQKPQPPYNIRGSGTMAAGQVTITGAISDDELGVTFETIYTVNQPGENIPVEIREIAIDTLYADGNNYQVASATVTGSAEGVVEEEKPVKIEIVQQPKLTYTYGETLDFSDLLVRPTFDSGRIVPDISFDKLADNEITITYDGTQIRPTQGEKLTVAGHNGKRFSLVSAVEGMAPVQTQPLTVRKKTLTVTALDGDKIYGEPLPSLAFTYAADEFVWGETADSADFTTGLTPPTIQCSAAAGTQVGNDRPITLSGGGAANYQFRFVSGTMHILPRSLDVTAITAGIPALTAKNAYLGQWTVQGEATAAQLTLGNRYQTDDIKISYDAAYPNGTPSDNVTVAISNVQLAEGYGANHNYTLRDVTTSAAGGKVIARKIIGLSVTTQPTLAYTYGNGLDISGGRATITYDNTEVFTDVPFAQLDSHGVALTYTGTGAAAAAGDRLTVPVHHGETLTLSAGTVTARTNALTIEKKLLTATADDADKTYGDPLQLSALTISYTGFAWDDTADTAANFVPPVHACDAAADTAFGDDRVISLSGGSADNYTFAYVSGTLHIQKRELNITGIVAGIPYLSAKQVVSQPAPPYIVPGEAVTAQLTLGNLYQTDDIKLLYDAVYSDGTPAENVTIGVQNVRLADSYGKNNNYVLHSVLNTSSGGRVVEKVLIGMDVVTSPQLAYTYGDTLDLTAMEVRISYDSDEVFTLTQPQDFAEHKISVSYQALQSPAATGDKLDIPTHGGDTILLTSDPEVSGGRALVTPAGTLTIDKKALTFGAHTVDAIVYDGATAQTTGTIALLGAVWDEAPTAQGIFTFDTPLAGEDKPVAITQIALDAPYNIYYSLPSEASAATGSIAKAPLTAALSAEGIALDNKTNTLTITAPELTPFQQQGGAVYAYSIDGGMSWQDTGVFENLPLGLECRVCIRFVETDNFLQSEITTPIAQTTFLSKITLLYLPDKDEVAAVLYTNAERIQKASELDEWMGNKPNVFYGYYNDQNRNVAFPYTLGGEHTMMVRKTPPPVEKSSGGKGGGYTFDREIVGLPPLETDPSVLQLGWVNPAYLAPFISGYPDGTFQPDGITTRAEFAAALARLTLPAEQAAAVSYPDVDDAQWYAAPVEKLTAQGIITGDGGYFRPGDPITRAEVAVMLCRALQAERRPGDTLEFTDVGASYLWAEDAIAALSGRQLVQGYPDGSFAPGQTIRRSEMVAMLCRILADAQAAAGGNLHIPSDVPSTHWAYNYIIDAMNERVMK